MQLQLRQITPHEMKEGKITSLKLVDTNKTDIIAINPCDFTDINKISQGISDFLDAKQLLEESYKEYQDIQKQFNLAQEKFNKLIAVKTETPPEPEPEIHNRLEDLKNNLNTQKDSEPEPEPNTTLMTPESEAERLVNDLKIQDKIFERSSAFNRSELQAEVANYVPGQMVEEVTEKVIAILESQEIIKSKGGIFKKLKKMLGKK